MVLPPSSRPSPLCNPLQCRHQIWLCMLLMWLPNYKNDVSSAMIWFRAKLVLQADNATDRPRAKKRGYNPL